MCVCVYVRGGGNDELKHILRESARPTSFVDQYTFFFSGSERAERQEKCCCCCRPRGRTLAGYPKQASACVYIHVA